jgi:hypothetical protein
MLPLTVLLSVWNFFIVIGMYFLIFILIMDQKKLACHAFTQIHLLGLFNIISQPIKADSGLILGKWLLVQKFSCKGFQVKMSRGDIEEETN